MNARDLLDAIGQADEESKREAVAALFAQELKETEESDNMNKRTFRRIGRTLLIAAAITAVLATTAFAADLFGIQDLLTGETYTEANGEEYSFFNVTQEQALPEELDPDIAEKLENNRAAWDEWETWREENPSEDFELMEKLSAIAPEGTTWSTWIEVTDEMEKEVVSGVAGFWEPVVGKYPEGSYVVAFLDENDQVLGYTNVSAEEMAAYDEETEQYTEEQEYLESHYAHYALNSREEADKLEEIAAKYGLSLRRTTGGGWPYIDSYEYNAYENLTEMMLAAGCAGNIFNEAPSGFDKIYWYDEGSFTVVYSVTREDNQGNSKVINCRGNNAVYSTMGSLADGESAIPDPDGMTSQSYTAADGTELTIFSNDEAAILYVYLEDSFFMERISVSDGGSASGEIQTLTDEDINYIADLINYTLIG